MNAVPNGGGLTNLVLRSNSEPINIAINVVTGDAKGFVVARNLGVVDAIEVSLFEMKPQTVYSVYVSGQNRPVASFTINSTGAANGTMIGLLREVSSTLAVKTTSPSRIVVMKAKCLLTRKRPSWSALPGTVDLWSVARTWETMLMPA